MSAFICVTCGTQFAETATPPDYCPICTDERQYVPSSGQCWTTLEELRSSHTHTVRQEEELIGIGATPKCGIGQRALLIQTPQGNVLWDCIPYLDPALIDMVNAMGGLHAISISHPHFYSTMVEWSRAFNNIPIYLHADTRRHVMYPSDCLVFWEGNTCSLIADLTIIRVGGHFKGCSVLHCANLHDGKGALLVGDHPAVVADRKHLAFMRSYPNYIPLGAASVRHTAKQLAPFAYDAIYGGWWGNIIRTRAKKAMTASVERHIRWIEQIDS